MQVPYHVHNSPNPNSDNGNNIGYIIQERDDPIDEDVIAKANNKVMKEQTRPRTCNERRIFQKRSIRLAQSVCARNRNA